eukprot:146706-Alexandrium_andersonii.AAC.1
MQMLQDVKALKATVFRCGLAKAESSLVKAAKASLREYRKTVEGNAGHSYGSPEVWIVRAFIRVLLAEASTLWPEDKEAAPKLQELANKSTPESLKKWVLHAK